MNKNKTIIIAIISFVLGTLIYSFSAVIFQEGNPWLQIKGIAQLSFSNTDMVKLSGPDSKYMTESRNGQEIIKDFMKNKGYEFIEQMGAGYLFDSPVGNAIVTQRQYSRFYSLWNVTEYNENKQNNLVEELRDCLPKSDLASHEKCNELLKQIIDFDSCAAAGFSILKSNPQQCVSPDGRNFTQETSSTWDQALLAINNCEIEKAFQMHSKTVTLLLKNSNKLIVKEPQIDDIITVVEAAEPKCGKIPIATE